MFRPRLGEGRVRSSLLTAFLMICFASVAAAAQGVTVSLKSEVFLRPGTILLGDIAELQGSDPARHDLANLSLGPVPVAGLIRRISPDQVREAVRNTESGLELVFSGAPASEVRLLCRSVEASELLPVIKAHVLRNTSWRNEEVEILAVNKFNSAEVPSGSIEFRIPAKAVLPHSRNLLLPVDVMVDGKSTQTLWVSCALSIKAAVLQAAVRIPYGKALSEDDVKDSVAEIQDPVGGYVRKYEEVQGQILRRTLVPGEPVLRETLTSPFLVRSGDTVRLRFEQSGISLATLVRAEQSGKLGQVIRVRNLDFMRSVKAQVIGPGEVKAQGEIR
jgi:flagella basal body P-ring formation protein FlgA